jgi:metal-responsive CopG/Arc/MetJ family transcriptional regulator
MRTNKINTQKISISISKDINNKLSEYCDLEMVNKSRLINKLIKDFLDKNTINKNEPEERKQNK